jgi:hypothetical protein
MAVPQPVTRRSSFVRIREPFRSRLIASRPCRAIRPVRRAILRMGIPVRRRADQAPVCPAITTTLWTNVARHKQGRVLRSICPSARWVRIMWTLPRLVCRTQPRDWFRSLSQLALPVVWRDRDPVTGQHLQVANQLRVVIPRLHGTPLIVAVSITLQEHVHTNSINPQPKSWGFFIAVLWVSRCNETKPILPSDERFFQ